MYISICAAPCGVINDDDKLQQSQQHLCVVTLTLIATGRLFVANIDSPVETKKHNFYVNKTHVQTNTESVQCLSKK